MTCAVLDKDQAFLVQDYGPEGVMAPVEMLLPHGLKPGAVISTVVCQDTDSISFYIRDQLKDYVIAMEARFAKNQFAMNSSKIKVWGAEQYIDPFPVKRGHRFVLTLIYEEEGYRIFINGAEVTFYKHRTDAVPNRFEVLSGVVYKMTYLTMKDIVPN